MKPVGDFSTFVAFPLLNAKSYSAIYGRRLFDVSAAATIPHDRYINPLPMQENRITVYEAGVLEHSSSCCCSDLNEGTLLLCISVYAVSVDVLTHAVDLHKTASR